MEKINLSLDINAPKEKVWSILWSDASCRDDESKDSFLKTWPVVLEKVKEFSKKLDS